MSYIIFLTVNTKRDKTFLGLHETENPEIFDGYLGDGIWINQPSTFMYPKTPLQCAVKKYGTDSFKRYTLFTTNSRDYAEEAFNKIMHYCCDDFWYNTGYESFEKIYQFDLGGNLQKEWSMYDACNFYGYLPIKFIQAARQQVKLLNSYWSFIKKIDVKEYSPKIGNQLIYYYYPEGKLMSIHYDDIMTKELIDQINHQTLVTLERNGSLVSKHYITNKIVDEFNPKPRREYKDQVYYVYTNNEFVGAFVGKEVMPIISLHSWAKIKNAIQLNGGWYKDFFISLEKVNEIPEKKIRREVDVYDKYGKFIETFSSIKELKEKYGLRSCEIKNIMKGTKYCKDWIFKYHSK